MAIRQGALEFFEICHVTGLYKSERAMPRRPDWEGENRKLQAILKNLNFDYQERARVDRGDSWIPLDARTIRIEQIDQLAERRERLDARNETIKEIGRLIALLYLKKNTDDRIAFRDHRRETVFQLLLRLPWPVPVAQRYEESDLKTIYQAIKHFDIPTSDGD